MLIETTTLRDATLPTEEEIRDYAFHLYEQNGRMPGHDVEDWMEATACLRSAGNTSRIQPLAKVKTGAHGAHRGMGPVQM